MRSLILVAALALTACAQTADIPADKREAFWKTSSQLNQVSAVLQQSMTAQQKQLIEQLTQLQNAFNAVKITLCDQSKGKMLDEEALGRGVLQCKAKK